MASVSFHLCQVKCLSRTQPSSRFMTLKTPGCSRTNRPSILTVGSMVQIQNCFSGCRLKIEPAFGGPGTLRCLRDHPRKLTSAGLYMATVGRDAGPDALWEPCGIWRFYPNACHGLETCNSVRFRYLLLSGCHICIMFPQPQCYPARLRQSSASICCSRTTVWANTYVLWESRLEQVTRGV